ncbi:QDE-2-interacting protein [Podospora conica]|nr:QDE-2-interacting protein [Schizothecium conicum]
MEATAQQPHPALHTGLLREENIILRRLFGYRDNGTTVSVPDVLGIKLDKTTLSDARFLCVDIDSIQEKDGVIQQLHIGVSLIDTSNLQNYILGLPTAKPDQMIESHHFVVGSPKFARSKSNKFLFGPFETIPSLADLRARLGAMTLHRNIILVCHGGDRELKTLARIDIDLRPVCIVDTVKAAQHPLRLWYRWSLERLLDEFEIPFCNLHTAGNDAHFILRALLMIVVTDAELESDPAVHTPWPWLPILRAIAHAPYPSPRPVPTSSQLDVPVLTKKKSQRKARISETGH